MSHKTFSLAAGTLFLLITIGHIIRVALDVEWTVAGRIIPMWPSWVGIAVAGFLAYQGIRLGRRSHSGP